MSIEDKIRLVFRRHPDADLSHRYEASLRQLPDDPAAWLDMATERANELIDSANQQHSFMKHWIREARRQIAEGDLEGLRESMLHVEKQWEAAQNAVWTDAVGRQLQTAGKRRGSEQREQRETEWSRWRQEAARIQSQSRRPRSKRELAAMVKQSLSLTESERTIRLRL